MPKYEVKEDRLRLVCMKGDQSVVLENIKKYDFLTLVGSYVKDNGWSQIIVDSSDSNLDDKFVKKFNEEVGQCLGAFENYDPRFD